MGLAVVVGGKNVSSYHVSSPNPMEEYSDDGTTILVPILIPATFHHFYQQQQEQEQHDQNEYRSRRLSSPISPPSSYVFCTEDNTSCCSSYELQGIITLSYYDMLRLDNGDCEYTIAVIKIQLSPKSHLFTTTQQDYPETIHRIRLPPPPMEDGRKLNDVSLTESSQQEEVDDTESSSSSSSSSQETQESLDSKTTTVVDPQIQQEQQQHRTKNSDDDDNNNLNDDPNIFMVRPKALISSSRRHLTILIPNDPPPPRTFGGTTTTTRRRPQASSSSSVIIFQLRRPKSSRTRIQQPSLPSYVQEKNNYHHSNDERQHKNNTVILPIATNPKLLKYPKKNHGTNHDQEDYNAYLMDVTSICDVPAAMTVVSSVETNNGSVRQHSQQSQQQQHQQTSSLSSWGLLLLGRRDGSIMVTSYHTHSIPNLPNIFKLLHVRTTKHNQNQNQIFDNNHDTMNNNNGSATSDCRIVFMDYNNSEWPTRKPISTSSSSSYSSGRLMVIYSDGFICTFQTEIHQSLDYHEFIKFQKQNHNDVHPDTFHESFLLNNYEFSNTRTIPSTPTSSHLLHSSNNNYYKRLTLLDAQYLDMTIRITHEIYDFQVTTAEVNRTSSTEEDNSHLLRKCMILPYSVKWVSNTSYVAVAFQSFTGGSVSKITVQVFNLYENHHGSKYAIVSIFDQTIEQLIENNHTYCILDNDAAAADDAYEPTGKAKNDNDYSSTSNNNPGCWKGNSVRSESILMLDYDYDSGCFAISGKIMNGHHRNKISDNMFLYFGCIWNWKTNVQGFTVLSKQGGGLPVSSDARRRHSISIGTNQLTFAHDFDGSKKLVHLVTWITSQGNVRIRKDIYNIGILSPSNTQTRIGSCGDTTSPVRSPSPLLLTATSISYPWTTKVSPCSSEHELEWRESVIPLSYTSEYGAPTIATSGYTLCQSIAIAGSRGVCILDCTDVRSSSSSSSSSRTAQHKQHLLRTTALTPHRWYLFGNVTEERSFRVVSMVWWERPLVVNQYDLDIEDDLLVAVIQVLDGDDKGYYMSCWSSRNLSFSGQLLRCSSTDLKSPTTLSLGIAMPVGFIPTSLDLLRCPYQSHTDGGDCFNARRSCVLIHDGSNTTNFYVYSLVTTSWKSAYNETNYDRKSTVVLGCQYASGIIGEPANLFLASVSCTRDIPLEDTFDSFCTCTIAILRQNGAGLDTVVLTSNGIISLGTVIQSAHLVDSEYQQCEITRIWLGDLVRGQILSDTCNDVDCFVWVLETANGNLLSWYAPFVSSLTDTSTLMRPVDNLQEWGTSIGRLYVHISSPIFGFTRPAGTTSTWMQTSSKGTRQDFLVGHVPKSPFGFVMGVAQKCTKLLRSLGEAIEKRMFRSDFLDHELFSPGDFQLYQPEFLPALYSLFSDVASTKSRFESANNFCANHCRQRLHIFPELRPLYFTALQLMILRCLEKLPEGISWSNEVLTNSKHAIAFRMFVMAIYFMKEQTTAFEFANRLTQFSRQLESSLVEKLFPLPPSLDEKYKGGETPHDMIETLLEGGSVKQAAIALPLLSDMQATQSMSATLFYICLARLDNAMGSDATSSFSSTSEDSTTARDIFRYAMKLSLSDFDFEDDDTDDGSSNDNATPQNYSIFCRVPFLSPRKESTTRTVSYKPKYVSLMFQEIRDGMERRKENTNEIVCRDFLADKVSLIVARYVSIPIVDFHVNQSSFPWQKVAMIAFLLLGESSSGFLFSTGRDFVPFFDTFNKSRKQDSDLLIPFFKYHIVQCRKNISESSAGWILDLIRLLLGSARDEIESEIPYLLLQAIVVGDVAGRINDILLDECIQNLIWSAYFSAVGDLEQ